MKIVFFSNWHGVGTTINSIVTSINLAMNYDAKVLLTHSQYTKSSIENAFVKKTNDDKYTNLLNFNDTGIDAIERLVKSHQLMSKDFSDYTLSILKNRLDLLIGSDKKVLSNYKNIKSIIDKADEYYDFTIIDVSEMDNTTKEIMNDADIIIYSIIQDEKLIKDFFEEYIKRVDEKKLLILLSRYDENVKCSARYIKNNFDWKDEIYKVNYSSKLIDSINNHSVLKFFYTCGVEDIFFKDLNLLSQRIVDCKKDGNVVNSKIKTQPLFNLNKLKHLLGFS